MSLGPAPLNAPPVTGDTRAFAPAWRAWISALFLQTQALGTNGTTAQRPVPRPQVPLYIGQSFFDQTLGYAIWIKSLNPTVWVNGAGAIV